jgi:hypothetical protein
VGKESSGQVSLTTPHRLKFLVSQKMLKATRLKDVQVEVRFLVIATIFSNTFFNGTPCDAALSAPTIASREYEGLEGVLGVTRRVALEGCTGQCSHEHDRLSRSRRVWDTSVRSKSFASLQGSRGNRKAHLGTDRRCQFYQKMGSSTAYPLALQVVPGVLGPRASVTSRRAIRPT